MGRKWDTDYGLVRAFSTDRSVAAFKELYSRYRDKVYATAYQITGDRTEALDVAQEVFLRVFRKIDHFRFESSFSSWLYRLTTNMAMDFRRRRRCRPTRPLETLGEDGELRTTGIASDESGPVSRNESRELSEEVSRALGVLSPKLRAVVVLRYLQGLDYEEVAQVIGKPVGTVKSRLNRAHEKLKPVLERLNRLV